MKLARIDRETEYYHLIIFKKNKRQETHQSLCVPCYQFPLDKAGDIPEPSGKHRYLKENAGGPTLNNLILCETLCTSCC